MKLWRNFSVEKDNSKRIIISEEFHCDYKYSDKYEENIVDYTSETVDSTTGQVYN